MDILYPILARGATFAGAGRGGRRKITANRAAEIALRFLQCYPDSHSVFDNGGLERLRLDEAEYVDMAQFTEKRAAEDC